MITGNQNLENTMLKGIEICDETNQRITEFLTRFINSNVINASIDKIFADLLKS